MPRIPRPGRRSPDEQVNERATEAADSRTDSQGPTASNGDLTADLPTGATPPAQGEEQPAPTEAPEAPAPVGPGQGSELRPAPMSPDAPTSALAAPLSPPAGATNAPPSPTATPPEAQTAVTPAPQGAPGSSTPPGAELAPRGDGSIVPAGQEGPSDDSGFGHRGQLRRRLRFLRRARELGLRDLGGLVLDMHRFGRPREDLVASKVATLTRIDGELRALQVALDDAQPMTVLREAGITACPVCAAIQGTEANFCSNCGLPFGRKSPDPVAGPRLASGDPRPTPAPSTSPGTATGAVAAGAGGDTATATDASPAEAGQPPAEKADAPAAPDSSAS